MARIRSIKPDFFTSETIAALPLSARLTFIGLWTYVDDNGVGLFNEMLINAAVWPLEEDSLETLARTREDLATLSRAGLVRIYRDSRKRYLFITSWDEHQKVDHPRKPRYPRPDSEGCRADLEAVPTCEDDENHEDEANDSREPREDLAPEQGAGSREQGGENPLGRQAGRQPEPGSDADPDFAAFWDAYPRKVAKGAGRKAWRAAVRKADPKEIVRAAERYRDDRTRTAEFTAHPATWLNAERWADYAASPASEPRRNRGFWED